MLKWPFCAAQCNGVSSQLLNKLTLMPRRISISVNSIRPSHAHQCNNVNPWSSLITIQNKIEVTFFFKKTLSREKKFSIQAIKITLHYIEIVFNIIDPLLQCIFVSIAYYSKDVVGHCVFQLNFRVFKFSYLHSVFNLKNPCTGKKIFLFDLKPLVFGYFWFKIF